ncbi:MAG: hypothetical protein AABW63_04205 [Nanoarchaeota archaeon]
MIKVRGDKLLLKPEDFKPTSPKFEILGVLNPGAVRLPDGKILLYVRVIEKLIKTGDEKYYYSPRYAGHDDFKLVIDRFEKKSVMSGNDFSFDFKNGTKRLTYISHLRRVILDSKGFDIISIEKKPSFYGLKWDAELGVEDARITKIGDTYYMTYVGLSRKENVSSYLAISKDCLHWFRRGIIFGEQDKDCIIFPEKVNGRYVSFDRPEGGFEFTPPHIWIAYSKDAEYWGKEKAISLFRKDEVIFRSGAGPPPIKTSKGWLLFFHAVTKQKRKKGLKDKIKNFLGLYAEDLTSDYAPEDCYSVWAGLFDLKNPSKLILRSEKPILVPKKKREISFEGKKVIFPTGIIEDGEYVLLYCGIGDVYVSVKKIKLRDVLDSLEKVRI